MNSTALLLAILSVCGSTSFAADYYVDVVNGSDANDGLSPASAWKTITHAAASAPSGPAHVVHVAPGTYSAATGEAFPLQFHGQVILGDAGADTTIVDGGGAASILRMIVSSSTPTPVYASVVRGLTFTNAVTGIEADCSWNTLTTSLVDVSVTNMAANGVRASGGSILGPGTTHLSMAGARFHGCSIGVNFAGIGTSASTLSVEDSSFEWSTQHAVSLGSGTQTSALFTRSRFLHNAGAGVRATSFNGGSVSVGLQDCLLARNAKGYSSTPSGGQGNGSSASFTRCTIADNTAVGIESIALGGSGPVVIGLDSTLVQGNAVDVLATNVNVNVNSAVALGDPRFVDRANDDYRLRFGSYCADAGNPATPPGTSDLAGFARAADGDLDTVERADIGCFEFRPLGLVTSGHLSSPLRLEFWGETGSTAVVYFSRLAPVAPSSTPFGEFDLNPAVYGVLLSSIGAAPDAPVVFNRPIPNNAALIGRTFSFQALTTSSSAPQGAAYTNVVSATITP